MPPITRAIPQSADERLAGLAGLALVLSGLLVIIAWFSGNYQLTSLMPDFPSMKFNTAFGITCLGTILLLLSARPDGTDYAIIPSVIAFLLGAITLLQGVIGADLGIDQLFAVDPLSPENPGRMSDATATSLILCGLLGAMATRLSKANSLIFDFLLLSTPIIPLFALSAYIYNPQDLFAVSPFSTMALHTALGFFLFLVGLTLQISEHSAARFISLKGLGHSFMRPMLLVTIASVPFLVGFMLQRFIFADLLQPSVSLILGSTILVLMAFVLFARLGFMLSENKTVISRQEVALASSQTILSSLIGMSSDVVMLIGPDGKIVFHNESARDLLGYDSGELVGKHLDVLIPMHLRHIHHAFVDEFQEQNRSGHGNIPSRPIPVLHKSGEEIKVALSISQQEFSGKFYASAIMSSVNAQEMEIEELRTISLTDPLTGTYNRRALQSELDKTTGGMRSSDRKAIIVADLDHFKKVNDTYGHGAGDVILREAAERWQGCLRETDVLYRFGGEEFIIICEDVDPQTVSHLGERLRHCISERAFRVDGQEIFVTVSIGISTPSSQDSTVEDMFKRADLALYEAKSNGRNRLAFAA